jgi:D-arabinose 1-dehydrogenase-like Zn-dependent alcohol dehydrogenase
LAKDKGADVFCVSSDPKSIMAAAGTCDLILNTVSGDHDINTYLPLLAKNATIV